MDTLKNRLAILLALQTDGVPGDIAAPSQEQARGTSCFLPDAFNRCDRCGHAVTAWFCMERP